MDTKSMRLGCTASEATSLFSSHLPPCSLNGVLQPNNDGLFVVRGERRERERGWEAMRDNLSSRPASASYGQAGSLWRHQIMSDHRRRWRLCVVQAKPDHVAVTVSNRGDGPKGTCGGALHGSMGSNRSNSKGARSRTRMVSGPLIRQCRGQSSSTCVA